eukprot:TRINITY_DN583_c0_g1_i1.p1 TRINITY_DN583_c0_g1~~TRINITY_DN583_c0_g1_i1.p1  ORF type:complete len:1206 (+),score=525.26 TRINITY_DN583_c0_g1_i1:73-3690(+)
MAALVAAAAAAVFAQQTMPNIVYLIEPMKEKDNFVGGRYGLEVNVTCNDNPMWKRLDRDNETGTEFRLYTDPEGYWTVAETCDGTALFRSLVAGNVTGNLTSPTAAEWTRDVRGTWIIETSMRARDYGCPHPRGCLQLHCQEPDDDFKCHECSVDGAQMTCDSDDTAREITLYVVAGVIAALVIAFLVVLLYPIVSKGPLYRSTDVAELSYKVGLQIGRYYVLVFAVIMCVACLIAGAGLPVTRIRKHGSYSSDWAPRGGQLERELDFVDKWTESSKTSARMYMMLGREDGSNAMTREMALTMLNVYQRVWALKVPASYENGTQVNVTMHDICISMDMPFLNGMPCMAPSVLDCFFEGGWLFDDVTNGTFPPPANYSTRHKKYLFQLELLKAAGGDLPFSTYDDRPSLFHISNEEFTDKVTAWPDQCLHWLHASTRSIGYMLGSIKYDDAGKVNFAEKLIGLVLTFPADRALEYKPNLFGLAEREVDDAIERWYEAASDLLEEIDGDNEAYPGVDLTVYMSQSPKKMFEEISRARAPQLAIGVAVVYVVAVLSQVSCKRSQSLARAAIIGTTMVIISNLCGYGFIGLLGIKLNHAMLQALPFIALGLGVDDMFLLLHYYRAIDPHVSVEVAIGELFREGGMSVTLTSLCNAISFFAGTVLPIPALRDFLLAAGLMVLFNYIIMVFAFPAVLAVEHKLRLQHLKEKAAATPDDEKEDKDEDEDEDEEGEKKCCPPSIDGCYIPFMQRKPVLYGFSAGFIINIVFAIVALSTFAPLDFGLSITDLTPRGSYLSRGFEDIEVHLLSQRQEHSMVVKGEALDLNTREGQLKAIQFENLIANNKWTSDTAYNANSKFFVHIYHTYCAVTEETVYDAAALTTMPKNHKAKKGQLWYVPEPQFYTHYHDWRNPAVDPIHSISSQTTDGFGHRFGADSYSKDNTLEMFTFPYSLDRSKLTTTRQWMDHVNDMHEIADKALGEGMSFPQPSSDYLDVMEFQSLRENFWKAAGVSIGIIFVICVLFAMSLRGAFLVAATSAFGMIETAATAMVFGLDFSSLVAVTLLMSIGMFVEFSAHVVIAHEIHRGTRAERQATAMRRTMIPVLEGGISSMLSFVLLAFSEFPYVFKYFFFIFFVVILIGLNHGLLLLPALLGTVGYEHTPTEEELAQKEANAPFAQEDANKSSPVPSETQEPPAKEVPEMTPGEMEVEVSA